MTYNIIDEASIASSSLHGADDTYEDLNDDIDLKRTAFGQRTGKDISMDLNDLLAEMEEERDESHSLSCDSSDMSGSMALSDVEDSPQRIGSKLKLDDLPSTRSVDNGSLNWGSLMGSFSKLKGSSRRLLQRKKSIKKKSDTDKPERRKKVRFQKFETVFYGSFSKLRGEGVQNHNC